MRRPPSCPPGVHDSPPTVLGDATTVGSNTTLNLRDGAAAGLVFVGLPFGASDAVLNVDGGQVAQIGAFAGGRVNIGGAPFGGPFVNGIQADAGSAVRISGGTIGGITAAANSTVELSGGTFGGLVRAAPGSAVTIRGAEFLLNGVPSRSPVTVGGPSLFRGVHLLTGTLADGTPFIFSSQAGNSLSDAVLVNVPVPPIDTTPLVVDNGTGPAGLRAGQTLTLRDGGELPHPFVAVGATLRIEGGVVRSDLKLVFTDARISGGQVARVDAHNFTELDISGDAQAARLNALIGSRIHISGDVTVDNLSTFSVSATNISGGSIGVITVGPRSTINISGGTFGQFINTSADSEVSFLGGEFQINGQPTDVQTTHAGTNDVVTGTLADGTPFILSPRSGDQLFFNNSFKLVDAPLPAIDTTPLIITTDAALQGLRKGQSLTLRNGGKLRTNFLAVGAELNIDGGTVGAIEVVGTQVRVTGGTIVGGFKVYRGSEVYIAGGALDKGFSAYAGSVVRVSAGTFGRGFGANSDSVVEIFGGSFSEGFTADTGSLVNIFGGNTPDFFAKQDALVNLFGRDFKIDGVPVAGLSLGEAFVIAERDVVLSGVLADGTPFDFDLSASVASARWPFEALPKVDALAIITVTLVPEPGAIALLLVVVVGVGGRSVIAG